MLRNLSIYSTFEACNRSYGIKFIRRQVIDLSKMIGKIQVIFSEARESAWILFSCNLDTDLRRSSLSLSLQIV